MLERTIFPINLKTLVSKAAQQLVDIGENLAIAFSLDFVYIAEQ